MNALVTEIQRQLHLIAPDIDVSTIDPDGDLREEFDMDSMDFLHLITALSKRYGIAVPESDYSLLGSYNSLCRYMDDACEG